MVLEALSQLVIALISLIRELGYLGIFIGMTIESSFFPFPNEIILIPAGALVAKGQMNFFLVFLAGLSGSLAGAWITYALAFFLGRKTVDFLIDKYGKFLFLTKVRLRSADNYFKKYGEITIFIGRLIFIIRHLISLPAGFAKMNFWKFTLYTALGAGIWTVVLICVGFFFGSNVNNISKIVAGILFGISVIMTLVYAFRKTKKSN